MRYQAELKVHPDDNWWVQQVLKHRRAAGQRDGTIVSWTVNFDNGANVDVNLVAATRPYIDTVLFDKDGHEIGLLDPGDCLVGDALFAPSDGGEYALNITTDRKAAKMISKRLILKPACPRCKDPDARTSEVVTLLGVVPVALSLSALGRPVIGLSGGVVAEYATMKSLRPAKLDCEGCGYRFGVKDIEVVCLTD